MVTIEVPQTTAEDQEVGSQPLTVAGAPRRRGRWVLLVVALGMWLTGIALARGAPVGTFGLLATEGGVVLLGAATVAIIAFVWAIAVRDTASAVFAIVVVTVVHRVTATVLTDVPIYVWAYKHIGIANYMIEDHSSPNVQIYGDWPSFFAGMAWFSTITGLDAVTVAHWFAPLAASIIAVLVGALAKSAGFSTRVALVAAMLAVILNWTGQDYYSPQAMGLILALAILTLMVHSRRSPVAGYLSVPLYAVLVATHQLTPFWLFFVMAGFAVFNQLRPRWLPVMYGIILALYVFPRLNRAAKFDVFSGFNPLKNGAVVAEERGSVGREFTLLLERGLFVAVWLLAAVCVVLIWRRYGAPWGLAIAAFSPAVILAGQDYGGEAIIRVWLYSIGACAVLLAVGLVWLMDRRRLRQRVLAGGLVAAFLVGVGAVGFQGYYGGWSYVTVSRAQLELSRGLLSESKDRYVIGTIAQQVGWPEQSTAASVRLRLLDPAYDSVFDGVRQSLLHKDVADISDVQKIEGALSKNGPAKTLYVVLPRQLGAYAKYLGWFPPTFVPSLVELLSERPKWSKVVDDGETVIFAYQPRKE